MVVSRLVPQCRQEEPGVTTASVFAQASATNFKCRAWGAVNIIAAVTTCLKKEGSEGRG